MVDKIYEAKSKVLERMAQAIGERGVERMDVTEMGRLSDIVKDLSEAEKACWEAEYYRSVTESMGSQGYTEGSMGYGDGRMGYRDSRGRFARAPRRGYDDTDARGYEGSGPSGYDGQEAHGYEPGRRAYAGPQGYTGDPMQGVREALSSASPEQRDKMMREMRTMVGM